MLKPDVTNTTTPLFLTNRLFMLVTGLINHRFRLGLEDSIRQIGQKVSAQKL